MDQQQNTPRYVFPRNERGQSSNRNEEFRESNITKPTINLGKTKGNIADLVFILIIFAVIFGFIMYQKKAVNDSISNLSPASYASKIEVDAQLWTYKKDANGIVNGSEKMYTDPAKKQAAIEKQMKNSNSSNGYQDNTSSSAYTDNSHVTNIRLRSNNSYDDSPDNRLDIRGIVKNNDTKAHELTLIFTPTNATDKYSGKCWVSVNLEANASTNFSNVSCDIKNLPIMNVNKPEIMDGSMSKTHLYTVIGDSYQNDWNNYSYSSSSSNYASSN